MTQNTYTVTTPDGDVEVKGLSAYHDRDALIIYADAEQTKAAAVFRRWEHVTVERRPELEHYDPSLTLGAETFFERRCALARRFDMSESEIPAAAVWFMSDHRNDHPRNWTDESRLAAILSPRRAGRA